MFLSDTIVALLIGIEMPPVKLTFSPGYALKMTGLFSFPESETSNSTLLSKRYEP